MSADVMQTLRWASLARDVAVLMLPDAPVKELDTVLRAYHLTKKDFEFILKAPSFQDLLKSELDNFKSQPYAGHRHRAVSLSQALSEQLFREAMNGGMEAKDSLKLLELLLKSGGMMDNKTNDVTVNVQNNTAVALPLPKGLMNPKLRHLEAQ